MKRYIHTKTGNPYTVVTDNFMFKQNGKWIKNLVLYRTQYDNPDGEFFARTKEDFEANFKANPEHAYCTDDDIMLNTIDQALEWLDNSGEYFSEPITISNMREWLVKKFAALPNNDDWMDTEEDDDLCPCCHESRLDSEGCCSYCGYGRR